MFLFASILINCCIILEATEISELGRNQNPIFQLFRYKESLAKRNMMRSRNYYQQNKSLILQFIVSDYLATCELLKEINENSEQKSFPKLKKIFNKLIGRPDPPRNCLQADSLLFNLQSGCQHLTLHMNSDAAKQLQKNVQKILELCPQAWQVNENSLEAQALLITTIIKIQKALEKTGALIAKLFLHSADDEIVLLFLLQNRALLDKVYHQQFVADIFSKMFVNGVKEAKEFIIKRYTRRGYKSLVPVISEAVKELKKDL